MGKIIKSSLFLKLSKKPNEEKVSINIISCRFSIIILLLLVVIKCGTHCHAGKVLYRFFYFWLLNIFLWLRKFIESKLLMVDYHWLPLLLLVRFNLGFKQLDRLRLEKFFFLFVIRTFASRFFCRLLFWLWKFYYFVSRPVLKLLEKLIPLLLSLVYLIYPFSFLWRYHNLRYPFSILKNFFLLLHCQYSVLACFQCFVHFVYLSFFLFLNFLQ